MRYASPRNQGIQMEVINGTVPHFIKVQMGVSPDPKQDGTAVPYIPLDESPEGVAKQLAKLAKTMVEATRSTQGAVDSPTVVNVDGTPCEIPMADQPALIGGISQLVAPKGWGNT
jgi:hypothetical protein